jgi:hypothetical protein
MSTVNVNRVVDTSGGVLAPISSVMRNRIINGAMVIDQRNAGASVTATGFNNIYTLDRWNATYATGGFYSVQQNAGSVTPPAGFRNYLGITSLGANTGVINTITQSIEGFNIADLNWGTANASTVTLSFWVRSSLTGTFGGAISNSGRTRSYPFSYTISAANTWEFETITIAGDTSGTWLTTNGIGLNLDFGLGNNATYSGTAGAWSGSDFRSATGAVSVVGTNGATFYITGVQLERGTQATSFEYRQYGTELALCQRYCFKMGTTSNFGPYGMGHGTGSANFRTLIKTAQTMRAQPSLSFSAANTFQWSFGNVLTAISAAEYGVDAFSVSCDTTGVATNSAYLLTSANNTTSSITASAEL